MHPLPCNLSSLSHKKTKYLGSFYGQAFQSVSPSYLFSVSHSKIDIDRVTVAFPHVIQMEILISLLKDSDNSDSDSDNSGPRHCRKRKRK